MLNPSQNMPRTGERAAFHTGMAVPEDVRKVAREGRVQRTADRSIAPPATQHTGARTIDLSPAGKPRPNSGA
jgi:hypothetical protein